MSRIASIKIGLLALLVTCVSVQHGFAQRIPRPRTQSRRSVAAHPNLRAWLNYGEGLYVAVNGDPDGLNWLCGSVGLTVAHKDFCIKPRFTFFREHELISDIDPFEFLYEFGILIGSRVQDGPIIFRFMGGLGYVWGEMRAGKGNETFTNPWTGETSVSVGRYGLEEIWTIGVPVEVDLCISPHCNFGLGLSFIADLNAAKTMAGLMVSLNIGRLDRWGERL